ncbi:hypothetical protein [Streptomyces graminilatus]|uniref:hypothetical protein n=1 Tax=Streptomyces graminilatus TaxID=1464070 RepID=UPI0006E36729|nr:hypothetical protein [Streptomyces graminilatus]
MSRGGWAQAIADLQAQGDAVRSSVERVEALGADAMRDGSRTTAVAISYAAETDYVRSALVLLRAHLDGGRPPRSLPVARMWPRPVRDIWKDHCLGRLGGVWGAIPGRAALESLRSAPSDSLLGEVIEQVVGLQASLHGHRRYPRMKERYIPDRSGSPIDALTGGGRPAPTLPGFPDRGHPVNLAFAASGTGERIQPDRIAEADQLRTDEFAVHKRALAFGDAVLTLLGHHHPGDTTSEGCTGRVRGAGRWVGQEKNLVPDRPAWPSKLDAFQVVALSGLLLLLVACAAIPLTFAKQASLFSYYTWAFAASGLMVTVGGLGIYRTGPRLLQRAGWSVALPGIAAGLAAIVVWQAQGPVANYYFAGPYERYERQYTEGCLAASPYRRDAIQSWVDDGVLVVTPISDGTTLRLGPAEDGGTHPLRPLDQATRDVLAEYGC